MTQLELIEELFDGIGENISPEEGPIRFARLSVACARGLQILAIAVDALAEKLDRLEHSTDSVDPIEIESRFADLHAQLAEMTKESRSCRKNDKRTSITTTRLSAHLTGVTASEPDRA
jgi:hypothetical protein